MLVDWANIEWGNVFKILRVKTMKMNCLHATDVYLFYRHLGVWEVLKGSGVGEIGAP